MTLEYLSGNSVAKYPFADTATLKDAGGVSLPEDTILDVIVACKQPEHAGAYMSSIVVDAVGYTTTFTIEVIDQSGADYETFEMVVPHASIVEKGFYGLANDEVAVKLVFGPSAVSDKLTSSTRAFVKAATLLAPSAVILADPRVKSIKFYNWSQFSDAYEEVLSCEADEYADLDLIIEEGYNVSFTQSAKGAAARVFPTAGKGLYPCDEQPLAIKTIDSVGPDKKHNFLLVTDDCYITTPADNGLILDNICTPKCTKEQLDNFTHYLNRVRDGMDWLTTYAQTVASLVRDEIDRYADDVQPNQNTPFYKVKLEKFATVDVGRYYYSFAIGFYNPTEEPIALNLVIDTDSTTTGLIMNTAKFRIGKDTTLLADETLSTTIPCLKLGVLEFVISSSNTADMMSVIGTLGSVEVNYSQLLQ